MARPYAVEISAGAEADLDEIIAFVAENDSPGQAAALLDRLLSTAATLAMAPQRGSIPRELLALGIRGFRQTMFKPYRLIYTIGDAPKATVTIIVIADGRRDLATLLQRRLLRG